VSNPGCYATAAILALAPLAGAIDPESVVVDAKSGVSGAGKTPSERTHFSECYGNLSAYGIFNHRHAGFVQAPVDLQTRFTGKYRIGDRGGAEEEASDNETEKSHHPETQRSPFHCSSPGAHIR